MKKISRAFASILISTLFLVLVLFSLKKTNLSSPVTSSSMNTSQKESWFKEIKNEIKNSEQYFHQTLNENVFQTINRKSNLRYKINPTMFSYFSRDLRLEHLKVSLEVDALNGKHDFLNFKKAKRNKGSLSYFYRDFEIHYESKNNGVRQDFIIPKKIDSKKNIELDLKIYSQLKYDVKKDKVLFKDGNDVVLTYQDLKVIDANGKTLEASFIRKNNNRVAIVVDATHAKYPVRIDPLATTPAWSYENNQADSYLGYSVSYIGDVNKDGFGDVLVAAPFYDNGETDEGIVYLFKGSLNGLSSIPSWSYECNRVNCQFGFSVDGAGDLNNDGYKDIVIGAPFYSNGQNSEGAIFTFLGNATSLNPTPQRIIESNITDIRFGYSVSGGGRFNNDNFSDVVVGAPLFSSTINDVGRIYLFRGSSTGLSATATTIINGFQDQMYFGEAVKILADFDGNGFSDLLVGAPLFDNGQLNEGAVFLFKGASTGLQTTVFWQGEGNRVHSNFGSVLSGGDINADGKTDFVVGAPRWSGQDDSPYAAGAAYGFMGTASVLSSLPAFSFFGEQDWDMLGGAVSIGDIDGDRFSEIVLSSITHSNMNVDEGKVSIFRANSYAVNMNPIWTRYGNGNESYLGHSSAIGDINGDNVNDLILAAVYESNGETYEGKTYSFHGSKAGMDLVFSAGFNFNSQASSSFGATMSSAGDVNGDGFDDVLVGAYNYDNGQTNEGRVFLFKGSSSGLSTTPDWFYESNQASSNFGFSLNSAGDINGDGYADVIVGAYLYDNGQTNEGRAFIFHGSNTTLLANPTRILENNQAQSRFSMSVAGAGDVNNDGFDDVLVGAPYFDSTITDVGRAYLYLGSIAGISANPTWIKDGSQMTEYYSWSLSSAGDTDNDGHTDIVVGSPRFDNIETDEGKVEVFLGNSSGVDSIPNFVIESNVASAQFGYSVSGAQKLNNDDYSDILVGAPFYKNTLTGEGAAFVFYGSDKGTRSDNFWMKSIAQSNANFGKIIMGMGDTDGDGYDEIAVMSPLFDNGQTNEGAVFIFNGTSQGVNKEFSWRGEGDIASIQYGTSIASNLDIDNDGLNDLVVGAPISTITNTADGKIFTYYGNQK